MKNFLLLACFMLVSSFAQAQYSRSELQEMYVEYLKNEGYSPMVDDDGDVQFKKEGKTYFIDVEETDLNYFRIVLPNIWNAEDEMELIKMLAACNHASQTIKVAKAYVQKDNVWVCSETLIADPREFKEIFPRCLSVINSAKNAFVEKMKELNE